MVALVVLVIAVVAVVLVLRSARAGGSRPLSRPPRPSRRPVDRRPLAPDDDPQFLRELERRARRDDGSTTG